MNKTSEAYESDFVKVVGYLCEQASAVYLENRELWVCGAGEDLFASKGGPMGLKGKSKRDPWPDPKADCSFMAQEMLGNVQKWVAHAMNNGSGLAVREHDSGEIEVFTIGLTGLGRKVAGFKPKKGE